MGELLCKIGLTVNESRIYLEMLKLGDHPVSLVAKRVGVNRTTAYAVLNSLKEKGLVGAYLRSGVQYFVAHDPNALIGFLDTKVKTFDYFREEILHSIAKLRSESAGLRCKDPSVVTYEGLVGVRQVLCEVFSCDTFETFLPLSKYLNGDLFSFWREFEEDRIFKKNVRMKALLTSSHDVTTFCKKFYDDDSLTEFSFISSSYENAFFSNQCNIYADKVAMINLDPGKESAIVICDEKVAAMHKKLFEMIWNEANL